MTSARNALVSLLVLIVFGAVMPLALRPATAEAAATDVVINEFLASNSATLSDNTGAFEDWIELHNPTGSTVDMTGWTIADSGESFTFASGTTIAAGAYIVIWASGDVGRTTASELHLPFKLSGAGDSLTLADATGTASTPSWSPPTTFPTQLEDDSYGIASDGQLRYFTTPTPGAVNGAGSNGLVQPVTFSVEHGFYNSTQSVVLDTPTSSATIRYTTNGDAPSSTNGTAITAGTPISVSSTSTIRAVAYRDGWITSPTETRSYLFTSDIIGQAQPAGWPSGPVNGQAIDYGMDPNVVNGNESAVQAALQGIPSISIVTDLDNLLDASSGIYVNASQRGEDWERQASVELIDPNGAEPGFDIEAGIRIRGGFSRSANNPKHALRLYFRDEYESELDYPFFGDEGTDAFEIMDLRTSSNYAWSWRHTTEATFIDELWSRDTQAAMGQPYTRSRPYHVYLNGTYWGLYQSQERVSGEYGESYFGGNEDDYDVVKRAAPARSMEAGDGTDAAWKSLFPLVNDLNVTNTEYDVIASQVDIVNLADYYLLHFFSGDYDGSPSRFFGWEDSNNWFALRNRNGVGPAAKWRFFDHDSEHSLCAAGFNENMDNTTPWSLDPSSGDQYMAPSFLHEALITNDAYRQVFADRVQLHMVASGGALTVPEALARLNARVGEVSPAIEAESARWGDGGGEPAYGRTEWLIGVAEKQDCFAKRVPIVEAQLRADNLWPLSDPPTIAPAAGAVPFGTNVTGDTSGQDGFVYFTTDGSDPRATDGSISASAQILNAPLSVAGDLTVRARVLDGAQWSPLAQASYSLSTAPGPLTMALNEFSAVSASSFLGGGAAADAANGSDATFGRIAGNGGDWFELITIEDGLDIRGWTVEVWNNVDGVLTANAALTFTNDDVFDGLLAGTILTVSEDIDDDISYDPVHGDWHINVRANGSLAGSYVTAGSQSNFAINNSNTQIALFDSGGTPVQLRTGEGTAPNAGISSTEVFKLEAAPTADLLPDSPLYSDGTTSTWGLANVWAAGAETQDLSDLRITFGDVNCDSQLSIGDALMIAQFSVGTRSASTTCPLDDPANQIFAAAADVNDNGVDDIGDALLVAQCSVGLTNSFCTN